jgi:hypothetical protein
MLHKLKEFFKRVEYELIKDDFLALPSAELIKEMEGMGWSYEPRKDMITSRGGPQILTNIFNVTASNGQKLYVGADPALWKTYENDRTQALKKIYSASGPK